MGKTSRDYLKILDLIRTGFYIERITLNVTQNTEKATFILVNDQTTKNIVSTQNDVINLAISWKQACDQYGNGVMGFVSDTSSYYQALSYLYDPDDKKLKSVPHNLKPLRFDPHSLIEDLLTDKNYLTHGKKYKPLFDNYYEILWLHVAHMKDTLEAVKVTDSNQQIKHRRDLLGMLFSQSFRRNPSNCLKNYQDFQECLNGDLMSILENAEQHLEYVSVALPELDGKPAKHAIRAIIDDYQKKGEIILQLMKPISYAIQLANGDARPDKKPSNQKSYRIIKNDATFSPLIGTFDPEIRHADAHVNYAVDDDKRSIHLKSRGRNGKILKTYTYDELPPLWRDLNITFASLTIDMALEDCVITHFMLKSPQYKLLLASLNNFKPEKTSKQH